MAAVNPPATTAPPMAVLALSEEECDGLNLQSHEEPGITALMFAAKNCMTEVARVLLIAGADPNSENERGDTALIIAARGGCVDIVRALLDKEANPNHEDISQETPLTAAGSSKTIVRLLLAKGGNPDKKDPLGCSARSMFDKSHGAGAFAAIFEHKF